MGVPKLPEALGLSVVTDAEELVGTTYTENGDFLNASRHNVAVFYFWWFRSLSLKSCWDFRGITN